MPTKTGEVSKKEREAKHAEELREKANRIFSMQQENELLKRKLQIATQQWDNWKACAAGLNDRLQKYEPGSVMVLNKN